MRRSIGAVAAVAALTMLGQPAQARDLFEGNFTVDGQTAQRSTSNAERFIDLFTDEGLQSIFGSYTPTSAASADASLRGVPAILSYQAGSPVLRLQVPGIGLDRSFAGATRDESQDMALRWLRGEGSSELSRLLQYAVATTPIDPVAGNPNSLMAMMGAADFGAATGAGGITTRFGGGRAGGRFDLGARFGSYSASGFDTDVYTLPLGYSHTFESGMELIVDAPLTLVTSAGGQSYSGSLGVGLRVPIRGVLPAWAEWSLTPMARFGGVGSMDLGAVAGMWSVSLTSTLVLRFDERTELLVGNMVSRLQTVPISVGDLNVSYELKNNMFRNGLVLTRDVGEMWGRPLALSGFVLDTRFSGDALFIENYQEYGAYFSLGDRRNPSATPLKIGFTYMAGERGYSGFSLNMGISF